MSIMESFRKLKEHNNKLQKDMQKLVLENISLQKEIRELKYHLYSVSFIKMLEKYSKERKKKK
jgi:cell division protein FtsB